MSSIFNIQKSFRISLGSPKLYAKGAIFVLAAMWLALPSAVSAATITASQKPAFQADLTSTLKLQAGVGSPTFTRATTAYVQDFEGLLKPVLSGEARFQGARRVENLVTVSETSNTNTAVTVTANALSKPLTGYSSAALAVPTTASSIHRMIPGITRTLGVGSTVWYVAVVKAAGYSKVAIREQVTDGTEVAFNISSGTILYESYTSATGGLATITSKGNGWYQIAVRKTNGANTGPFMNLVILPDSYTTGSVSGAWVPDGSSGIYVTGFQEEDQTGQANTNPSEYVSKGVLAAPYHGAGVDGVKYFNTLNGNTVTSNVVGEASGGKITSAQAAAAGGVTAGVVDAGGPMGYLAEGARTNLALQSNALTTTWLAVQTPSATQNVTGPDGVANSAWTLTDNNASAAEYVQQNITLTAATYTQSWYIKKTTGAQTSYPVMLANSNTKLAAATIDTTNGIATVWTAYTGFTVVTSSATCASASASWWRCQLTFDATAESWVNYAIPAGATSATQSSGILDVSAQGSAVFYGGQVELGSFASSYIPTTTGSATRNADALTYSYVNNINGTVGSAYAEVKLNGLQTASDAGNNGVIDLAGNRPIFVRSRSASKLSYFDGTNNPSTLTWNDTSRHSMAISWSGSSATQFFDGSANAPTDFDGNFNVDGIYIGVQNSGVGQTFGTIRNVKIWKKALTGTQLTTMTNTGTATSRAAIPQTSVKAPTGTGLVGHWTFNEGTGTKANDSSGTGNSGTLSGAALPTWTTGKLGKALSFNGTSAYVDAGNGANLNIGTQNATVSLWIKAGTQVGAPKVFSSKGDGITSGYDFQLSSSKVVIRVADGTTQESTAANGVSIDDNVWHNVVTVIRPGVSITRYVDGVQNADVTSITVSNIINSGNLLFGKSSTGYYLDGKIDDVRIYNRALSTTEINALYRSAATVVNTSTNTAGGSLTSGLVGLWSFDGKDMNWGTNKALDRGSGGNHGTLTSMSTSTSPVMGKIGQGLKFDGVDDVVNLGMSETFNLGAGSFALCAWIKTTGTEEDIVANGAGTNGNYLLMSYLGKLRGHVVYSGNNNSIDSNATVNTGTWQHACQVVDSTNIYLYINGSLDKSQALVGTKSGTAGTGVIGHRAPATAGAAHFDGSIDDVRLYNRALSATEVKALYNLGR